MENQIGQITDLRNQNTLLQCRVDALEMAVAALKEEMAALKRGLEEWPTVRNQEIVKTVKASILSVKKMQKFFALNNIHLLDANQKNCLIMERFQMIENTLIALSLQNCVEKGSITTEEAVRLLRQIEAQSP